MSIYKFTDSFDNNKTYSYKILVYPNITFQKDLEKDSYVVVLGNIIRELNKIRDDIHWTIFSPGGNIQSLSFENTLQLPIKFPPYPNAMRLHFNQIDIIKQIDFRKNDYDIVYSHLPEHTLQLKNVFLNETNIEPKFIGYTHWTEFPEITNYAATVMDINFLGLLAMEKCGVNTQGQKNLILKNTKKHFNDEVVKRLDDILEPQYLGWEIPKYEKQTTDKKIIVYNHRPHTYKNYPWFLEQMDKLWEKRKDFEVWVPLADSKEREYMTIDKYDRVGYFSKLSSCYLGVCAKQKYSGWAVSATDGMSVGVPYLFSDDDYYHELAGNDGVYYKDESLVGLIEEFLDDIEMRNVWSQKALNRFEQGKWETAIVPFNNMINDTIENLPMLKSDTDTYKKVVDFIHRKKSVTKSDILNMLNWGVRISFSGYRNRLRNEPTIRFTKDRYEVIE
jgi:glycosyltransferase involved in cell wall biosynthesis